MPALRPTFAVPLAALAAAFALAGPPGTSTAAAATVVDGEACQYSIDGRWRTVPVRLSGTLRRNGVELQPGQAVGRGDAITLTGATVSTELDPSIAPLGYDAGILPPGQSAVPVRAWVALEATNTAQGIAPPVELTATAVAHVTTPPGAEPTPTDAYFDPVVAPIPDQSWTATGGDVVVRQAPATRMGAIPAGRDGATVRVNGSLFVSAALGGDTQLFLDCAPGDPLDGGRAHGDRLFPALAVPPRVPGFTGTVDGAPLAQDVDATATATALPRADAGQTATVADGVLRLRLTAAQRSAWLGGSGTASISGTVELAGDRSVQGAQTVPVTATAASTTGADEIALPLGSSAWTPTGTDGVDVRTARELVLIAVGPAGTRVLRLQRADPSPPYPFAYVLGPDPLQGAPVPPADGSASPPALGGGGFAPPPAGAATKPAARATTVRIRATTLRRRGGKLRVTLANLRPKAVTRGRVKLVTTAKHRVAGRKVARRVTLATAKAFSLRAGRRGTVVLRVSNAGNALLRTRRSVRATLTVVPKASTTQRTVTRKVTVRR
jgi:hypothetical protein